MELIMLLSTLVLLAVVWISNTNLSLADGSAFSRTIVVDAKGNGQFPSLQAAINAVPDGNDEWVKIQVKSGVYREKVIVPIEKEFILVQGEGRENTIFESSNHLKDSISVLWPTGKDDTFAIAATFSALANNTVVMDITFKNTYTDSSGGQIKQALAAYVDADKVMFQRCGFVSFQDTLCDFHGRHYYKDCYIEGAIDFIFGVAQSLYENCTLYTKVGGALTRGWITAQGRRNPNDPNAFVFKSCNVTGPGPAYLGRPWGPYPRVLFYDTFMSTNVLPVGWESGHYKGQEKNFVLAEDGCKGPGSNFSERASFVKHLSQADIAKLTSIQYIDAEGWLAKQPK